MGDAQQRSSDLDCELVRLRAENEALESELDEAQETLRAIRAGEVDALVVSTPAGERVFTLQGGEHPYRALIEQMREGAATVTPQGVIHYCNHRFAEMLGRPLHHVMGGRLEEFVAPIDRRGVSNLLGGAASRIEVNLASEAAAAMPVLMSAVSLEMEGPAAICLVVTDLSERKRHEAEVRQLNRVLETRVVARTAELAAAKDLLSVTLASIGDGVIVTDAAGRVTFLNPEAERLTGWTNAAAAGQHLTTVFHIINEHTRRPVEDPAKKVLRLGKVVGMANHTLLIGKDGRETPIDDSGAPIRGHDGAVQGVVLVFRDNSQQKDAERALRVSEERFRLAAAAAHAMVFDFDVRTGQLNDLQGVSNLLGYAGAEIEMTLDWWNQRIHPEDLPACRAALDAMCIIPKDHTIEYRVRHKDGRLLWVEDHAMPLIAVNGDVVRVVGTVIDITARKEADEALRQAMAAAEAANLAKSRFLANISHELRTPMNAILGMIDLALPKQVDAASIDLLTTARGSADLLLALLNDLLDSAKIEAGKLDLEAAPFSLRAILNQTTQVLAVRASEKGVAFSCRTPPDLPDALVGDQVRLRQILLNLGGNAIKFTERGEVTVGVRVVSQADTGAQPAVAAQQPLIPNPQSPIPPASLIHPLVTLEFSIRDTGVGMSPAEIDRIFEPFAQADPSTARRFGGTGLGLTISTSLVALMGGRLWVESTLGQGSTFFFTVRLPLAKELPTAPPRPAVVAKAARVLRVLLAEDNSANQKLITYILRARGHELDIASDGQEAIDCVVQDRYDVILMDVQMPGMDGMEATQAIRAREAGRRRVPIIAMTAHAMTGDRERCLDAGMDGYLAKPIDGKEMIALVESLGGDEGLGLGDSGLEGGGSTQTVALQPLKPNPQSLIPPLPPCDLELARKKCFDDQGMLEEMVKHLFQEAGPLLDRMRKAVDVGDGAELANAAHRLRGTIVYLAAESAFLAAQHVEAIGGRGELFGAGEAVDALARQLDQLCEFLAPQVAGS